MLYLVLGSDKGVGVSGPWNGLGLRGNASAPMRLEGVRVGPERALSAEGKGFDAMLGVVLPWFQIGSAAVSVGVAEAAVGATQRHLTAQRFEHLGSRLCDLPNLRARLAQMRIETDKARAHLRATLDAVESGAPTAQLLVLQVKSQAADAAQAVTDLGMKACGGAAFSRHLGLERAFRDARAAGVMAPTTDVAHDFIGRALCGMDLF
jgi:alkylation response protein AidB-like acyl-CoA dehydrogenase